MRGIFFFFFSSAFFLFSIFLFYTMSNPFTESSIQILKEAFPKVQESVIDDMLWTAKGNVQDAFEMLLSMTNGPDTFKPLPKVNAKPLSVREELDQWRQDLRKESKQRATVTRNVQSTPSFSNMFRSSRHEPQASFNPFEEQEVPPPAYHEINRDTLIHNK
ncbi:uncharacterized protein EV154DRAFT_492433 [Mucor mucedo]|uniref:uncharacterized protein n=1 Tax=Mucor mucedo TaxID=29922 RepID=UPI00222119C6|nr:uncharacterized protein EV154DRAFT_492433 [Mucor mucedo]KAI7896480.1 hypothetical protein EV154DRAFT_492433 [Mucor mucedo]